MNGTVSTPLAEVLDLAASQLEVAVHSTQSQIEALSGSIAALVTLSAELLAGKGEATPSGVARQIAEQARNALVAMQFHDQLVQRVAHVRDSLTRLNEALAAQASGKVDWSAVLAQIRDRYTMEDERLLFDRIIGVGACPAVATHDSTHDSRRGSVELF